MQHIEQTKSIHSKPIKKVLYNLKEIQNKLENQYNVIQLIKILKNFKFRFFCPKN